MPAAESKFDRDDYENLAKDMEAEEVGEVGDGAKKKAAKQAKAKSPPPANTAKAKAKSKSKEDSSSGSDSSSDDDEDAAANASKSAAKAKAKAAAKKDSSTDSSSDDDAKTAPKAKAKSAAKQDSSSGSSSSEEGSSSSGSDDDVSDAETKKQKEKESKLNADNLKNLGKGKFQFTKQEVAQVSVGENHEELAGTKADIGKAVKKGNSVPRGRADKSAKSSSSSSLGPGVRGKLTKSNFVHGNVTSAMERLLESSFKAVEERGVGLVQDQSSKTLYAVGNDGKTHAVVSEQRAHKAAVEAAREVERAEASGEDEEWGDDADADVATRKKQYARAMDGDAQEARCMSSF